MLRPLAYRKHNPNCIFPNVWIRLKLTKCIVNLWLDFLVVSIACQISICYDNCYINEIHSKTKDKAHFRCVSVIYYVLYVPMTLSICSPFSYIPKIFLQWSGIAYFGKHCFRLSTLLCFARGCCNSLQIINTCAIVYGSWHYMHSGDFFFFFWVGVCGFSWCYVICCIDNCSTIVAVCLS